jgi:hypothetical protein
MVVSNPDWLRFLKTINSIIAIVIIREQDKSNILSSSFEYLGLALDTQRMTIMKVAEHFSALHTQKSRRQMCS